MGKFSDSYQRKLEAFRKKSGAREIAANIATYHDPSVIEKLGSACVTILLSKGRVALIDLEDEALVKTHSWYARMDRWGHWYAYGAVVEDGRRKEIAMHRFIVGAEKGTVVDHRNLDGLDNRRCNLRICTNKQNVRNARPYTGKKTSKFKGVSLMKSKRRFRAQIMCSGVKINLGNFADEKKAALAYDEAARKLFGEFARCNFPKETAA